MTTATLLLTGGPHPFAETTPLLTALLREAGCSVTVIDDPDSAATALSAGGIDLLVVNTLRWQMLHPRYDSTRAEHSYRTKPETAAAIDAWVRGGGRMLACHGAPICFDDWPGWGDLLGARWDWEQSSHPPLGPTSVHVAAPEHPIVRGLADAEIIDECYSFLEHTAVIKPLLTGRHTGLDHPLVWELRPDAGHVLVCLLGHGPESFQHPVHAEILRRGARHLVAPSVDTGRTP